ncbi:MAG: VTT domain-containing protein [Planctomycetia bacterium]|nr:VTT domain-containing protein [Planctomycetia bacterium]
MPTPIRLLVSLTAAAIAVPLVPWLLWGTRLDHAIAAWLDPPPPAAILAAAEVGVLAADILLPVPSSLVATLGGASLGVLAGTLCAWAGMTLGSLAGWWLGRTAGGRSLESLDPVMRASFDRRQRRIGPLLVVLTRPLPILAEAAALMAGAAGMSCRTFLAAAGMANLAIAFAWSLAGSVGKAADSLQWFAIASLAVPAVIAAVVGARRPREDGLPTS